MRARIGDCKLFLPLISERAISLMGVQSEDLSMLPQLEHALQLSKYVVCHRVCACVSYGGGCVCACVFVYNYTFACECMCACAHGSAYVLMCAHLCAGGICFDGCIVSVSSLSACVGFFSAHPYARHCVTSLMVPLG